MSLFSVISCDTVAGTIRRSPWGRTTSRIDCQYRSPIDAAASPCPRSGHDPGSHDLGQHSGVVERECRHGCEEERRLERRREPIRDPFLIRVPPSSGIARPRYRMMKTSGRFRHTSTQTPAATLTTRFFVSRSSASTSPKPRDRTIVTAAIWRLIQNPDSRNRRLFPEKSHSQFAGSNSNPSRLSPNHEPSLERADDERHAHREQQVADGRPEEDLVRLERPRVDQPSLLQQVVGEGELTPMIAEFLIIAITRLPSGGSRCGSPAGARSAEHPPVR